MGSPFHGEAAISPASGYAGDSRESKLLVRRPATDRCLVQFRGAVIGGGPRPTGFFGRSVPT